MTVAIAGGRPTSLLAHAADDFRAAARSGPYRAFVVLWLASAAVIVARRDASMAEPLAVIAGALVVFGALAWFANRVPGAHSAPDPVRAPRPELLAMVVTFAGIAIATFGLLAVGAALAVGGLVGWLAVFLAARPRIDDLRWLVRSWLPLVPFLAALAAPKLVLGAELFPRVLAALPSGMVQQVLLQVGLTARIEAVVGRRDLAAVVAAVAFGIVHIPLDLEAARGDWIVAAANAMVLQAGIGLIACAAYLRHRAPLALGTGHALLMA